MYNCAVAGASADILKKVPLFAGLDNKELTQIANSMRERHFKAGDTVTQEGAGARTDMVCYGMTPWDFRPLVETNSTIAWKLLTAMAEKLR